MKYKKCLSWVGSGLALFGSAFVIYRLINYGAIVSLSSIGSIGILVVSSLIMVYGIANILLALSWRQILAYLNVKVEIPFAVHTYGTSQLAKYLPGNIFHLAGRQAIGVAAGLPGWSLAKSAIWEIATNALTAALFGILVIPSLFPLISINIAAIIFIVTIAVVLFIARRYVSEKVACAIVCYIVFLTTSGLIFVTVVAIIMPENKLQLIQVITLIAAYVIAWLAGLVTPGAPAGVGVREMVILFLLQNFIGETYLLTAIVIGRIVTVAGDLFFYLIAVVVFRNKVNLPYG
jgi:glycosyltransferase 2 family protein